MAAQEHSREDSMIRVGSVAIEFASIEQAHRFSEDLLKNGYVRVLVDGEPAA